MRLTDHTDFALRVLMYLTMRRNQNVTIQELADAYGISRTQVARVVHHLSQLGVILTSRGRGGGMRLNRDPSAIQVGWVVRNLEFDLVVAECFDRESNRCVITPACVLKKSFEKALEAFLLVLNDYSLADLVPAEKQQELSRILRLSR